MLVHDIEFDMLDSHADSEVVTENLDLQTSSVGTQAETRLKAGYMSDSVVFTQRTGYRYPFLLEPIEAFDFSLIASPSLGLVFNDQAGSHDVTHAGYVPSIAEPASTKPMPLQGSCPVMTDQGISVLSASATRDDNLDRLQHSLKRCSYEGCGETFSTKGALR